MNSINETVGQESKNRFLTFFDLKCKVKVRTRESECQIGGVD